MFNGKARGGLVVGLLIGVYVFKTCAKLSSICYNDCILFILRKLYSLGSNIYPSCSAVLLVEGSLYSPPSFYAEIVFFELVIQCKFNCAHPMLE